MSTQLRKLCSNINFLVIEDFENFRSSIKLMLTSFGAKGVDVSPNAEHALDLCRYQSFDVILCDFNLGAGKNGLQILEELRIKKRLKRTHLFVMVTADTSKEAVLSTKEFQPDAYIAKPLTRHTLEQRLTQLLTQQAKLRPINKEIDLENYVKAISLCQHEIEQNSRYRSWCLQTMAELYLKLGDTGSAQKIYADALSSRNMEWAKLGMGKVYMSESLFQEAKNIYSEVIDSSPYMVEAYEGACESCVRLGQRLEAQKFLESAVEISPRMVTRQAKLAQICIENSDFKRGAEAYRRAVSFAENSIHETPDLYLDFGRCLTELAASLPNSEALELSAEARRQLDVVLDRFYYHEEACYCASLVKARIYANQGDLDKAAQLLDDTADLINTDTIPVDLGLELSRSLYACGRHEESEKLLISLSHRFEDDPDALARIEALLDEPEPPATKLKAKSLNKEGILMFEKGQLHDAIAHFKQAIDLTPKHAALNLNLAQVALRAFKENKEPSLLEAAHESLARIEHIPKQHKQYRRLQHLKQSLSNAKG